MTRTSAAKPVSQLSKLTIQTDECVSVRQREFNTLGFIPTKSWPPAAFPKNPADKMGTEVLVERVRDPDSAFCMPIHN